MLCFYSPPDGSTTPCNNPSIETQFYNPTRTEFGMPTYNFRLFAPWRSNSWNLKLANINFYPSCPCPVTQLSDCPRHVFEDLVY